MPKQEIKVEFTQKGAPQLTEAIHKLANSTNKLKNTQQNAVKTANGYTKSSQRVSQAHHDQEDSLQRLMKPLAMVRNRMLLLGFGYGMVLRPLVNTTKAAIDQAAKFESLRVRLNQLYGSVAIGSQAFAEFNKHAAKTPFALDDIVNAGAQFKAFGGDSRKLMGEITDLAAFMGTTATEAANSLGRAFAGGAGAADILREKGILNLVKSFKGIDDLSKLTLPQFREALISTIQDPMSGIAGATNAMANTYNGAISNMQDANQRMQASLGDFLLPTAKDTVKGFTGLTNTITDFFMEWNQSAMERMVQQLRDMNIESSKLAKFELILVNEKHMRDLDGMNQRLAQTMLYAQGFQNEFGTTRLFNPFSWFDDSDFDKMNREVEEATGLIDGLFSVLQEADNSGFDMGFFGAGGRKFKLADYFVDLKDHDSIKEAMDQIMKVMEHAQNKMFEEAQGAADPKILDYYEKMFNIYASVNKELSTMIHLLDQRSKSEKALQALMEGKDGEEAIFEQKDIDMIKEFNEMFEKSDHVRKKVLEGYKEFLITRKDDLIAIEDNIFSEEKYKVVLQEVNEALKSLNKTQSKSTELYKPKKLDDYKAELILQNKQLERTEELLQILENTDGFAPILENLNLSSKKTKEANKELENLTKETEKLEKKLAGIYNQSYEARVEALEADKKWIQGLIDSNEESEKLGFTNQQLSTALNIVEKNLGNLTKSNKSYIDSMVEKAELIIAEEKNNQALMDSLNDMDQEIADVIRTQILGIKTYKSFKAELEAGFKTYQDKIEWEKKLRLSLDGLSEAEADFYRSNALGEATYTDFIKNIQNSFKARENESKFKKRAIEDDKNLNYFQREYAKNTLFNIQTTDSYLKKINEKIEADKISINNQTIANQLHSIAPKHIKAEIEALGLLSQAYMNKHGITSSEIKSSKDYLDQLTEQNNVMVEMDGILTSLANEYSNLSEKERKVIDETGGLEKNFDNLNAGINRFTFVTDQAASQQEYMAKIMAALRADFDNQSEAVQQAVVDYEKLHGTYEDGLSPLQRFLNEQTKLFNAYEEKQGVLDQVRKKYENLDSAFARFIMRTIFGRKEEEKNIATIEKLFKTTLKGRIKATELIIKQIKEERDGLKDLGLEEQDLIDRRSQANQIILEQERNLKNLNKQLKEQKNAVDFAEGSWEEYLNGINERVKAQNNEELYNYRLITSNRSLAVEAGLINDAYLDLVENSYARIRQMNEEEAALKKFAQEHEDAFNKLVALGELDHYDKYEREKIATSQMLRKELENTTGLETFRIAQIEMMLRKNRLLRKEGQEYGLTVHENTNLLQIYTAKLLDSVKALRESVSLESTLGKSDMFTVNTKVVAGPYEDVKLPAKLYFDPDSVMDWDDDLEFELEKLKVIKDKLDQMAKMPMVDWGSAIGSIDDGLASSAVGRELYLEWLAKVKRAAGESEEAIERLTEKIKNQEAFKENIQMAQEMLGQFQSFTSFLSSSIDREVNENIKKLKKGDEWRNASTEKREALEEGIRQKAAKDRKRLFYFDKALTMSQIAMDTALAIMKTQGQAGIFGAPYRIALAAMGATQLAIVAQQKPPVYEMGGLVGGRRHSSGGTLIEAEQGEFVMNRNAVESIGINNLERMNSGGGGEIVVNITGNVLTSDFVENELAEKVQEAVRKGVDFGIS